MNAFHLLTVVLVILKITGYARFSWFMALLPSIILFVIFVALLGMVFLAALITGGHFTVKSLK